MLENLRNRELFVRWAVFLVLFAAFIYINLPFAMTLILSGIFALGIQNFISSISQRTKIRRTWCVLLTMFGCIALFLVPILLAVYRVVTRLSQPQTFESGPIIEQMHSLKDFAVEGLQKISSWTGTDVATPAREMLENFLKKTGEVFISYSTNFVSELPTILLAILVFLIATTVLLLKDMPVKSFVLDFSPFDQKKTQELIYIFKKSCSVTLFSTFVIGIIQAFIIGLGSLALGEGDFWLVITVTFFVSFIPVIGAAPVGYALALLAFMGDRTGSAIALVLIATVAGTIDNILKPILVSGEFKINAIWGFTCVVGAIIMLGLPGLLLGPVIMNLFVGISPMMLKNRPPNVTE